MRVSVEIVVGGNPLVFHCHTSAGGLCALCNARIALFLPPRLRLFVPRHFCSAPLRCSGAHSRCQRGKSGCSQTSAFLLLRELGDRGGSATWSRKGTRCMHPAIRSIYPRACHAHTACARGKGTRESARRSSTHEHARSAHGLPGVFVPKANPPPCTRCLCAGSGRKRERCQERGQRSRNRGGLLSGGRFRSAGQAWVRSARGGGNRACTSPGRKFSAGIRA